MSIGNLGLLLDNTLGIENKVNSMCKSFYYQIRNIGLIRKYINDKTYTILVQELIMYPPPFSDKRCCTSDDMHW